jgi:hypothetical protein
LESLNRAEIPQHACGLEKRLGENGTGPVLARCHIWVALYRNRLHPLPKGGCDSNIVHHALHPVNTYY